MPDRRRKTPRTHRKAQNNQQTRAPQQTAQAAPAPVLKDTASGVKLPPRIDPRPLFIRLVLAWVFAWSMSMLYFPMLWMPRRAIANGLFIAAGLLLLLLLTYNKKHTAIALAAGLVGLIAYFLTARRSLDVSSLTQRGKELIDNLNATSRAISSSEISPEQWDYDPLTWSQLVLVQRVIAGAFTLLSYLCVARYPIPLLLSTLLLFFLPVTFLAPARVPKFWLIPAFMAILLAGLTEHKVNYFLVSRPPARGGRRKKPQTQAEDESARPFMRFDFGRFREISLHRLLPFALAALIALSIMPFVSHKDVFSPALQGLMDDFSSMLPRSYLEKLELQDFSLAQVGYYPLEAELGGPVELTDEPVMSYQGPKLKHLAGIYYDFYSGLLWSRTVNNPYYRFNSNLDRQIQEQTFPRSTPWMEQEPGRFERWNREYHYTITPERPEQAVFQGGITRDLRQTRRESRLLYYNPAGNIYSREPFAIGSPMEIAVTERQSPLDMPQDDEAYASDFASLQAGEFPISEKEWNFVFDNYLQLPNHPAYQPGGLVYETAQQVAGGYDNPIDQLRAIRYFFETGGFSYSLNPPERQPQLDFVADFLQQRVGYCVYFASASTMMARLVGIPARYVEGFALPEEADEVLEAGDSFTLEEQHAHAWSEVYIPGLGWTVLDPTPGGVDSAVNQSKNPPEPPPTEPTTTPPTEPTTTPTTPPAEEPTTTPEPTTAPDTPPQTKRQPGPGLWIALGLILLFLLLALAWVLWKKWKAKLLADLHDRAKLQALVPESGARLALYWDLIRELILSEDPDVLEKHGGRLIHDRGGLAAEWEALQMSPRFSALTQAEQEALQAIYEGVNRSYFSPEQTPEALVQEAAELFDHLEEQLRTELSPRDYFSQRAKPQTKLKP